MELKDYRTNVDAAIRDYMDNNRFIDSNWSRVANTQMFRVDVIEKGFLEEYFKSSPEQRRDVLTAVGGYSNSVGDANPLVTIHDIVGFSLPAERMDFASQTIFHSTRSAFVSSSRDQFRLRMIESSDYGYRRHFNYRYGAINDAGIVHYDKLVTKFPADAYYNLLVRQIKKDAYDGRYFYASTYFLADCVTENINDVDYSVEKMSHLMTEITGKTKKLYNLQLTF